MSSHAASSSLLSITKEPSSHIPSSVSGSTNGTGSPSPTPSQYSHDPSQDSQKPEQSSAFVGEGGGAGLELQDMRPNIADLMKMFGNPLIRWHNEARFTKYATQAEKAQTILQVGDRKDQVIDTWARMNVGRRPYPKQT